MKMKRKIVCACARWGVVVCAVNRYQFRFEGHLLYIIIGIIKEIFLLLSVCGSSLRHVKEIHFLRAMDRTAFAPDNYVNPSRKCKSVRTVNSFPIV